MKQEEIQKAKQWLKEADAILIGASNGLSIAEGYHIFANNDMFREYFGDFQTRYGIRNVIGGCLYEYPTMQEQKSWQERLLHHWVNNYSPSVVMQDLLAIVEHKDYFVLTSNGDTHLQISGFDANRVFEIEGNFFNLFQDVDDKTTELNEFIKKYYQGNLIVLELGIGINNRLIKKPLMDLVASYQQMRYITLNLGSELYIPNEIAQRSIGLAGDIAQTLSLLRES